MSESFKLKNEALFVVAEAVGGFYNADQLKTVAEISENESALLKMTEDQSIGFMVSEEKLLEIESKLQKAGLVLKHYRSHQVPFARSCLGELCPHFEQDALGDSIEIGNTLNSAFPSGAPYLKIGINGCSRNCLASGTDDVHIVGEQTGYKIQIGGKSAELPQIGQFLAENVGAKELGNYLVHIINTFTSQREANETFFEVVDRIGISSFELAEGNQHELSESDEQIDDQSSNMSTDDLSEGSLGEVLEGSSDALYEEELATDASDSEFSMEEADALLSSEAQDAHETGEHLGQHEDAAESAMDFDFEENLVSQETTSQSSSEGIEEVPEEDLANELASEELSFDPGDSDSAEVLELAHSDIDTAVEETTQPDESLLEQESSGQEESETDQADDAEAQADAMNLATEDAELETEDATEDDVNRVTLAMRSEAAFERGSAENVGQESADSNGLLSDSLNAAEESIESLENETTAIEAESESDSASDSDSETLPEPDIPSSFLRLQEQASNAGALQVRLVEDFLTILTPENSQINLPLQNLRAGMKIILTMGKFNFETQVMNDAVHIKFDQTSLSIPLSMVSPALKKAA